MSIRWPIAGLSGVLTLPLIAWLISTQGWRMACVIGGVVMLIIGIPLVWFCFKRHRPEYYGLLPDGAKMEEDAADLDTVIEKGVEYATNVQEVEFTLRQALKSPTFWLIMSVGAIHGLAMPVMNIHGIPFLTDKGIDPVKAAEMLATMVAVSLPARFVGGFLADRVKTYHLRFLISATYLLQAAGFGILLLSQSITAIYTWFALYGFGMGAAMPLRPLLTARYFGRKAFGSIHGTRMMLMTPIGVAGPIFYGWIYDTTGNYSLAFVILTVSLAAAGVIMSLILPPKPPAEITDVRKIM